MTSFLFTAFHGSKPPPKQLDNTCRINAKKDSISQIYILVYNTFRDNGLLVPSLVESAFKLKVLWGVLLPG